MKKTKLKEKKEPEKPSTNPVPVSLDSIPVFENRVTKPHDDEEELENDFIDAADIDD